MGFIYTMLALLSTFFAFTFVLAILAIPAVIIAIVLMLLGVTMAFWKMFLIAWLVIIVLKMLF